MRRLLISSLLLGTSCAAGAAESDWFVLTDVTVKDYGRMVIWVDPSSIRREQGYVTYWTAQTDSPSKKPIAGTWQDVVDCAGVRTGETCLAKRDSKGAACLPLNQMTFSDARKYDISMKQLEAICPRAGLAVGR